MRPALSLAFAAVLLATPAHAQSDESPDSSTRSGADPSSNPGPDSDSISEPDAAVHPESEPAASDSGSESVSGSNSVSDSVSGSDSDSDSVSDTVPVADTDAVSVSESPSVAAVPDRLAPLRVDVGPSQLRVGGLAQLTSEIETRDGDTDGFVDFRRLRVDVRALFLDGRVALRGHVSAMPRGAELLDLHVDAELSEAAHLRVGLAKTPFTAYRQQSINDHVLVDWPIVSRWFGGERQLGLTLEGATGASRTGASYAFGVYNGDPARPQNHRFSTAYGEKAPTRSGFRDATAYDVPHPELMGRSGLALGPVQTALSVAWDLRPVHAIDPAARVALEAHLDTEHVDVWAIGYLALHEELDHHTALGLGGVLLDASFRVHPRVELAARWSTVLFSDALREDARATADARIASAAAEEQSRLSTRYADVGHVEALHESTVGLAIYAFGHSLKWQTDATWLRDRTSAGRDDAFRLRLQAQLAF